MTAVSLPVILWIVWNCDRAGRFPAADCAPDSFDSRTDDCWSVGARAIDSVAAMHRIERDDDDPTSPNTGRPVPFRPD